MGDHGRHLRQELGRDPARGRSNTGEAARNRTKEAHKTKPDPLYDNSSPTDKNAKFKPKDFEFGLENNTCTCPVGKVLYNTGARNDIDGYLQIRFKGIVKNCGPCALRSRRLRTPEKIPIRQVAFFIGRLPYEESHADRMKQKNSSYQRREMITRRFATVEPVFGILRGNKRMGRFTLRGKENVDGQWKLFTMMHTWTPTFAKLLLHDF